MITITKEMTKTPCMKRLFAEMANHPRYHNFTFLNKPEDFSQIFAGTDYDIVQLHDITLHEGIYENMGDAIIGFVGGFAWKNNSLKPLDGDSYTKHTIVWGYEEWENNGIIGLEILTNDW